jgi:hypothetical protein
MIPVFAVGAASTAIRLLHGKAALVSHAYLEPKPEDGKRVSKEDRNWIQWSDLESLRAVVRLLVGDCGAFTYWQRNLKGKPGRGMCVERWCDFIAEHGHMFDQLIAFDVIGDADASLRNWIKMLDVLPSSVHPKLIPVWHEGDPAEHLDAYDPDARLVGLGRTTGRRPSADGRKATFRFYDQAFNAYPKGSFHFLGNANPETIQPYPARQFDATSWERDSAYSQSHGFPWSAVSKDTRMRAYIEGFESIRHVPRELPKQTGMPWASENWVANG